MENKCRNTLAYCYFIVRFINPQIVYKYTIKCKLRIDKGSFFINTRDYFFLKTSGFLQIVIFDVTQR